MKIKTFVLTSLIALGTCAINAHASLWTVTTQGTIDAGYDSNGTFGTAGQDLTGLTFTQTITASTDPAQWQYVYNNNDPYAAFMYGSGPGFTDTVTINGTSITLVVDSTIWGIQALADAAFIFGSAYTDEVSTSQYGYTANGQYVQASNNAYSSSPLVPSVNFGQTLFANPESYYNYFLVSGDQGYVYFESTNNGPSSISVNGFENNVPEPGSLALLGLGLAGLAGLRRKQS